MNREVDDPPVDFTVSDHGSIVVLQPLTPTARDWVSENVDVPDWARLGDAVAVEPRMIDALIEGIQKSGLALG